MPIEIFPLTLGKTGQEILARVPIANTSRQTFIKQAAAIVEYTGVKMKHVLYPHEFLVGPFTEWINNLPNDLKPDQLPTSYRRYLEEVTRHQEASNPYLIWHTVSSFAISSLQELGSEGHSLVTILLRNPDDRLLQELVVPEYHDKLPQPKPRAEEPEKAALTRTEGINKTTFLGQELEKKHIGEITKRELDNLSPTEFNAVIKYIIDLRTVTVEQTQAALQVDPTGAIARRIFQANVLPFQMYNTDRLIRVMEGPSGQSAPWITLFAGTFLTVTVMQDRIAYIQQQLRQPDLSIEERLPLERLEVDLLEEISTLSDYRDGKVKEFNTGSILSFKSLDPIVGSLDKKYQRIWYQLLGMFGKPE